MYLQKDAALLLTWQLLTSRCLQQLPCASCAGIFLMQQAYGLHRVSEAVLNARRTADHVDCITYLLSKGADAFCTTSAGDNCLHIAARNAHTHCIFHLLTAWVSVPHKPPCRLADAIFSDDVSQIKYVDLPNGGPPSSAVRLLSSLRSLC